MEDCADLGVNEESLELDSGRLNYWGFRNILELLRLAILEVDADVECDVVEGEVEVWGVLVAWVWAEAIPCDCKNALL